MDIIVKRIKEQRAKLGITQQQLAFDTGLSVAGIQSIETGRAKPSIDTLVKLANRFGCSTDYLLGSTDDQQMDEGLIEFKKLNDELVRLFYELPDEDKEKVIEIIKELEKKHR